MVKTSIKIYRKYMTHNNHARKSLYVILIKALYGITKNYLFLCIKNDSNNIIEKRIIKWYLVFKIRVEIIESDQQTLDNISTIKTSIIIFRYEVHNRQIIYSTVKEPAYNCITQSTI